MFQAPRNVTADLLNLELLWVDADGLKYWSLFSHVTLVAAAIVAGIYRRTLVTTLLTIATLDSLLYHACGEFDVCMGIPLAQWQLNDHLTAPLILVGLFDLFVILHDLALEPGSRALSKLPHDERRRLRELDTWEGAPLNNAATQKQYVEFALPFIIVPVALATFYYPAGSWSPQFYTVVLCTVAWLVYALVFRVPPLPEEEEDTPHDWRRTVIATPSVHLPTLIFALATTGAALGFFLAPSSTGPQSSLFHSFWHFFIGLGVIGWVLAIELRPLGPRTLVAFDVEEEEEAAASTFGHIDLDATEDSMDG